MSESSAAGSTPLYCDEDADEIVQTFPDPRISSSSTSSLLSDEAFITHLFDSDSRHIPSSPDSLRRLCLHLTSRQDSINWILKVHAYYHFKPETALLSVNYFDRFLSSFSLPKSGWPYQLLSVACLSLAAKMEEPNVPLLLDLQIFEPTFFFDPKTIQRMELWVMANLDWRLCSLTPFDFLDYFVSKLPFSDDPFRIFSTFSDLVLNTIRVIDFVKFRPSVIAAAAVITAAGENVELLPDAFFERMEKEMVRSCHQLMEEYLVDTCPSADSKVKPSLETMLAAPPSPVGVLDSAACVSCETRSENPCSASGRRNSGAGQEEHEPEPKRLRSSVEDVQELQR